MEDRIQKELLNIVRGSVRFNEPLREHTTIKIGGPADIWFEPLDAEDLLAAVKWADSRDIDRHVFGNGSNTLVKDKGIRGLVISLVKFDQVQKTGDQAEPRTTVFAGAGLPIQKLIGWSVDNELSGFERLTGIPGTVGGAVVMNAGTADGSIGDLISSISVVQRGKISESLRDKLDFSYRKLKLPKGTVITGAKFELLPAPKAEIESRIGKIRQKRKDTQPLLWPSLGSVFKNPKHAHKAWQLIDECNLRGVRVGGARVSNEHANWIINEGSATANDVEVLIRLIKEKVKEKADILLETEIVIMGE